QRVLFQAIAPPKLYFILLRNNQTACRSGVADWRLLLTIRQLLESEKCLPESDRVAGVELSLAGQRLTVELGWIDCGGILQPKLIILFSDDRLQFTDERIFNKDYLIARVRADLSFMIEQEMPLATGSIDQNFDHALYRSGILLRCWIVLRRRISQLWLRPGIQVHRCQSGAIHCHLGAGFDLAIRA